MAYFDRNDTPKPGDKLYEVCYMKRNRRWDWEDYTVQVYARDHREAIEKAKKVVNPNGTRGWNVIREKNLT